MSETTLTLDAADARAIAHCTSKERSRYALTSALCIPNGPNTVLAAATDGRCLAVRTCNGVASATGPTMIEPQGIKAGATTLTRSGDRQTVTDKRGAETTTTIDAEMTPARFPPIPDVFPDWTADAADTTPVSTITLNAALLHKLAQSLQSDDYNDTGCVTIMFTAPNKPIAVVGRAGVGLLMPAPPDGDPRAKLATAVADIRKLFTR